jgi:ribosomal protein S18 acetylase RimI-like enzyme
MGPTMPDYEFSFDPARIDVDAAHAYLSHSYWAAGIPIAVLRKAIENSLCIAVHAAGAQVGFARVATDRATFAYLADVYVLEAHRGRGLARELVSRLLGHPDLQGLRRLMLVTRDAQGLYEKLGFRPLAHPSRVMELHRPDVYQPKEEP